jgi:hypothetical protein
MGLGCHLKLLLGVAVSHFKQIFAYVYSGVESSAPMASLSLQSETIHVGELGGNTVAVALGRLEARLFDGLERFFVETRAAALDDLCFCDLSLWVNFNFKRDIPSRPARNAIGG